MKAVALAVVLALLAVACGDDAAETASTEAPPETQASTTSAPAATTSPSTAATTSSVAGDTTPTEATTTSTTQARPEGDPAPDFTVALGEGGSFTLSEEQKPVYMVFWAEW